MRYTTYYIVDSLAPPFSLKLSARKNILVAEFGVEMSKKFDHKVFASAF